MCNNCAKILIRSFFFNLKVFDGNSDQSTVVRHDLKKAIVTRFIRIHPSASLDGYKSLRAEFYGCRGMMFHS